MAKTMNKMDSLFIFWASRNSLMAAAGNPAILSLVEAAAEELGRFSVSVLMVLGL